jgi:hypothetical protein
MKFDLELTRDRVHQVLFRAITSYSAISNLAHLSSAKVDELLALFEGRLESGFRSFEKLSATSELSLSQDFLLRVRETTGRSSVTSVKNGLAAACVVFSHSLADGALEEFCLIAAECDSDYWVRVVADEVVTLRNAIDQGAEKLLRACLNKKIRQMSLPKKMKHLLRQAGKHAATRHPHFSFDKQQLERLDALRHEIVHRRGVSVVVEEPDTQEFFYNTTLYAGLVLSSRFGLGITYESIIPAWLRSLLSSVSPPGTEQERDDSSGAESNLQTPPAPPLS